MKFDLLYELQMPKPHDERSEYRCLHEGTPYRDWIAREYPRSSSR